ncbi:hypothetical protein CDAR_61121 [Caerostris darwini]|uniref:Uncharacterized protein n=1 Tax=Caerostris darwini TaxID=1538125 RepID=A0AAV4UUK4_9ARAC|nr:hypothetical protein CDAR_61121 [Caerostris darwini]
MRNVYFIDTSEAVSPRRTVSRIISRITGTGEEGGATGRKAGAEINAGSALMTGQCSPWGLHENGALGSAGQRHFPLLAPPPSKDSKGADEKVRP